MNIKIIHYNHFFGESLPTYKSMDMAVIQKTLEKKGFSVEFVSVEALQNEPLDTSSLYLCGSHQNASVKQYYDDVLDFPHIEERLIPRRLLIKAHENKGYQGLLARSLDIPYVEQYYFIDEKPVTTKTVVKCLSGAGSAGVTLCETTEEQSRFLRKPKFWSSTSGQLFAYLKSLIKFRLRKGDYLAEKLQFNSPRVRYVQQKFIPNLSFDYKVLVFMDKCFVLKRGVREQDFRASGSGKFEFIEPSEALLDFALSIRKKLNSPYVSLDVIEHDNGFECIEYQCVHFGPYTQMKAPKYYRYANGKWEAKDNNTILEELIGQSVADFVQQQHLVKDGR
ncbi:hypothetical protein KW419_10640 [Vibrio fluvialis]|nr:hypothetical protein [Vibrio fluvialis]